MNVYPYNLYFLLFACFMKILPPTLHLQTPRILAAFCSGVIKAFRIYTFSVNPHMTIISHITILRRNSASTHLFRLIVSVLFLVSSASLYAQPPTVTGFATTSAYALQAVTVNGTNFTGATQVQFGGVTSPWFEVVSATQIRAVVPIGGASGNVSVTTGAGTGSLAGFTFTATPPVSTLAGDGTLGFRDAAGAGAQFNAPVGVAFYAGNMFVADGDNNRVRRITPTGVVTTFAGSGAFVSVDGTGAGASFAAPHGIAADASGNLFVADYVTHRIRVISPGGAVTTLAGGTAGWNDATGAAAQFNGPVGVAFAGGIVYVSDLIGHRIRKITYPGGVVTTLAGSGGMGSADGTGLAAQFNNPRGIAVDAAGNVYVADQSNNRIRKITPAGVVTTLAGSGAAGFADGTGLAAQFNIPTGIAVDASGNLYVSDAGNTRIRFVTPAGVVTTLAGSGTAGFVDGTLAGGRFNGAMESLAFDASNNLFVVDRGNNAIRRVVMPPPTVTSFTPTSAYALQAVTINGTNFSGATQVQFGGVTSSWFEVVSATQIRAVVPIGGASGSVTVTTGAGPGSLAGFTMTAAPAVSTVAGDGTLSFRDAVGAGAQFNSPCHIVRDGAGNVYIADRFNNRIRRMTPSGVVTTLAGSGTAGGMNGTGTAAEFNRPYGIAINAAGTILYVAEAVGHRIRQIVIATGVVTTIAGSGTAGYADGTGVAAQFNEPIGLCTEGAGNLIVAEQWNHRIRRVVIASGVVTTVAGNGTAGFADGLAATAQFNQPRSPVIDAAGNIFIADYEGHRIRKITPSGIVTTVTGNGTAGNVDGGPATAQLNNPNHLILDAVGNLYFASGNALTVRIASPAGVVTTITGTGTSGFLDGAVNVAELRFVAGILQEASGSFLVTDEGNACIRRIVLPPPTVTSFAATTGYPGLGVIINGTNLATVTQVRFGGVVSPSFTVISNTQIVAVVPAGGASGNVQVTNPGGSGSLGGFTFTATIPPVSQFAGNGAGIGFADGQQGAARFNQPCGIAFNSTGDMFVSDIFNFCIRRITPAGVVTTFAGSGVAGFADGTGTAAQFSSPHGVVVDGSNNVLVADYLNHRIRSITPLGVVTTFAGSGTAGTADGTGVAAQLNSPIAMVFSGGFLYVSDHFNHAIRRITYPGGVVTTLAGNGTIGNVDGTGAAARFNRPAGIVANATGDLFVTDQFNHTIRRITPAGVVTTFVGSGVAGFADGTGVAAQFNFPRGITIDAAGNLYVSEQTGNRIRLITPAGVVTTLVGTGTAGLVDGTQLSAQISGPEMLQFNSAGVLFLADRGNNAIRRILPASPVVTSFNATTGYPGLGIIINGANFSAATQVQFGGVNSPSFTIISPSQIVAAVPMGGASGSVSVTAPSGTGSLPGFTFTAVIPPVSTFAGNGAGAGFADAEQGAARFNSPCHIVRDGAGNVYIADRVNHRIRRMTLGGVVTTLAGSGVSGGLDGTGTAAQFNGPYGIAINAAGTVLYVVELHRIRQIVIATGVVTTLAGSGTAGFADGTGAAAQFSNPVGVCLDGAGNLFVSDVNNHRIRQIVIATGVVSTIAGSGAVGFADGLNATAQFNRPVGLARDAAGNIYVGDYDNHRIRKITPGGVVTTLCGNGTAGNVDGGPATAQLNNPNQLWMDAVGNLYVASGNGYTVRIVSPTGVASTITGTGANGFLDGAVNAAQFAFLAGILQEASGSLLVTDEGNNRIRRIVLPAPTVTSFNATTGYPGLGVIINGTNLATVTQVTFGGVVSPSFTVISNTQIVAAVPTGGASGNVQVTNPGGSGSLGGFTFTAVIPPISTFVGNAAPAGFADGTQGAARFNAPIGIAFDGSGNMFVGDQTNHRIRKITSTGVVTTLAGSGISGWADGTGAAAQFSNPSGVATDAVGNVYVADYLNHRIRVVTPLGAVTTLAGSGVPGSADGTGLAAQFNGPVGIARSGGNLYVSDNLGHRIRQITIAGGVVTTLAGSGTAGFADATGTLAQFSSPQGLATDALGNVYVADHINQRIRKITSGGVVTTLAGSGAGGFADGTGAAAQFQAPLGVSVDAAGNVYVSDAFNARVRLISPLGAVTTLAASGTIGFVDGTLAAGQFGNGLMGIALNATNSLFIADRTNNAIRSVAPSIAVTAFTPTSAGPSDLVTITGINFTGATQVQFGGINAASFTVVNNNTITATPAAGGATGSVSVTAPLGTASLAGFTFLPNTFYFQSGDVGVRTNWNSLAGGGGVVPTPAQWMNKSGDTYILQVSGGLISPLTVGNGVTFTHSGSSSLSMNAAMTIAAGGICTIPAGSSFSINGPNTFTNNGTVNVSGVLGLVNTPSYVGTAPVYAAGSTLGYNGIGNQTVGVEWLPTMPAGAAVVLAKAPGNTLTLPANRTVNGSFGIASSTLVLGANTLTLNGQIQFGAGTALQGGATSGLTIGGTGTITGALSMTAPQTLGAGLTLNRPATLTLASALTATPLTLGSSGGVNTGALAHTFLVTSIGAVSTLNVTAGGSVTQAANYTVNGTIAVDGVFDAGTSVASGTGGITVNAAGMFSTAHPAGLVGALTNTGANTYNGTVRIQGATVGNTAGLNLVNLTIDRATAVTLPQNITINGILNIANTGNFDLAGRQLWLNTAASTSTSATGTIDASGAGSSVLLNAATLDGSHFTGGAIRRLDVGSVPTLSNSLAITGQLNMGNNLTLGAPHGRLWLRSAATITAAGTTFQGTNTTSEVMIDGGFNGGTMPSAFANPYNGAITFLGAENLTGNLTMSAAAGALSLGGNVNLQAASTLTLNQTAANSLIGTATLQGAGASSVLVFGNGFNASVLPANRFANPLNANLTTPGGASTLTGGNLALGSAQTLTLGGRLTTSAANLLTVTNTATTSIAGASATNFIDGPIERQLLGGIAANGTTYLMPIGEGANYRHMTLRDIRTGASPLVRATVVAGGATTPDNLTILTLLSGRNWHLEQVSGVFTSSTLDLTEGGLTPTDLIGISTTQAGPYASIGGTPGGSFVRSNAQAGLADRFYAIAGTPPGAFFYNETLLGDAALPTSWNSVPNGSGVPATLGLMTSGTTSFTVRSGITATALGGFAFGPNVTLTLQPASNLTVNTGTLTVNGTATVSGTLGIGDGATLLNNGTTTITATGALRLIGNGAVSGTVPVFAATSSALEYTGTTPKTAGSEWQNPLPYTVRVANAGGVRLPSTRTLANTANVNIQANGVLMIGDGVNVVNDGNMLVGGLGTMRLDGNGQLSGASGITYLSTSTLEFSNASATPNVTAGNKAFPASMNANVVVNNAVTLTESKQISGSWTGLGGSVNLNGNTLTLNNTTSFGGTSFVSNAASGLVIQGGGTVTGLTSITGGAIGTLTMARAGETLTNAAPVQVSNTLTLQNGFISTTLGMITLTNPALAGLVGGTATSHIIGGLERALPANLAASPLQYLFPVAKNGAYLPIVLTNLTTGMTAPILRAEPFTTSVAGGTLAGAGSLSLSEHWQTTLVSGSYTSGAAILTRSTLNAGNSTAFASGMGTVFNPSGGTLAGMNPTATLTSSVITGAGRFSITFPSSVLIGDFTPKQGLAGAVVSITGSGFTGATAVRFGGTNAASFVVNSATNITATVGAGATGVVEVVTPTGTGISDSTYTFVGIPTIAGFTPSGGTGRTTITLNGSNFFGVTNVRIGGQPVLSYTVISPTQISILAATGASGSVQVTATGGIATSSAAFQALPSITSFTPANGGTGTIVSIFGTNFTGASAVRFGGENALTFSIISPTRIDAITTSFALSGSITVVTTTGTAVSSQAFIVGAAPVTTASVITPNVAVATTNIRVTGSGFVKLGNRLNLYNGSMLVANDILFEVSDATHLTFTVPQLTLTGDNIPLSVKLEGVTTNTLGTLIFLQTPVITGFFDSTNTKAITQGMRGDSITIRGQYFTNVTDVSFGGTSATFGVPNVPTELRVRVPQTAQYGFDIVAVNARGVRVSAPERWFTIPPRPVITAQSLDSGEVGETVRLVGKNFFPDSKVFFNGVSAASVQVISTTNVVAIVPAGARDGFITLNNVYDVTTGTQIFRIIQPATRITAFSPQRGGVGTAVRLTGILFDTTGSTVVSFNGLPAQTRVSSTTDAIAIVPAGVNVGAASVSITGRGGTFTSTQAFIVLPVPVITTIDPISAGADEMITLTGRNFTDVTTVTINGRVLQNMVVVSDGNITASLANVPVGLGTVTAFSPGGQGSYNVQFELLPPSVANAPRIESFSPAFGPAGTRIVVRGRNFFTIASARVGGVFGTVQQISTTEVIVIVGRGATGAITLTNEFGSRGSRTPFRFQTPLELDSIALVAFYNAHRASNTALPGANWLTLNPVQTWQGITVGRAGEDDRILGITLTNASIRAASGLVTQELVKISELRSLNLSNNALSGDFPVQLFQRSKLTELRLANNNFTGALPAELTQLTALEVLDLRQNQLSGNISTRLVSLPRLRVLLLSSNRLTGSLPTPINTALAGKTAAQAHSVSVLETLDASNNQLSGAIPSAINTYFQLRFLGVANNNLTGEIPRSIGECLILENLALNNNRLSGAVPSEILRCTRLERVNLANNALTLVPNLTPLNRRLKAVFVENNRLDFGSLEPNIALDTLRYVPQDTLEVAERSVIGVVGAPLHISLRVGGASNRFAWERDGMSIDELPTVFALSDTGRYVCRITNTRVPNLTLLTRPITVLGRIPLPPNTAPQLVSPPNNANGTPTDVRTEWTGVADAAAYDIEIATTQDFTSGVTRLRTTNLHTTAEGLRNLQRYFWRVRAVNPGGAGPWSATSMFVTVRPGAVLAAIAEVFPKTPIADVSFRRIVLTNLLSQAIRLDSLRFSESGNGTENSFETRSSFNALTFEGKQERAVNLAFSPKSVGNKQGTITAYCTVLNTQTQEVERFEQVLTGRATALKAIPVEFDTVLAGKPTISSALLVNRGRTPIQVNAVQFLNSTNGLVSGVFSFQGADGRSLFAAPIPKGREITLLGGDTLNMTLRCEPKLLGNQTALLNWEATGEGADTIDVPVTAFVRPPEPSDVEVRFALRPVNERGEKQDSIAPGGRTWLEIYIAEGNLDSLLRVAQPEMRATVSFDRNVLSVAPNERGVRVLRSNSVGERLVRVQVPPTRWDGRNPVVARFECRAVAGDTVKTAVSLENVQWGGVGASKASWERRVFLLAPENSTFTALACEAGGTRLVTSAKATQLAVVAPNPAKESVSISYTLREDGFVEIALIDASGRTAQILLSEEQTAGDYTTTKALKNVPSGSYTVRLSTQNGVVTKRVNVVR
ncbi:MAG: T9SS C-terminal target domain-containing protein [Candidatus Kapaibacterium sp.]|nr:MAG: T9SS C-terminal target domain-containing protein [Candidatus Kapabacteria bacterium]